MVARRLLLVGDSHVVGLAPTLKPLVSAVGWDFRAHSDQGKDLRFFGQPPILDDLMSDYKPHLVVIVLGTNPSGAYPEKSSARYHQQIADVLHKVKSAKVVWVGPPTILANAEDEASSVVRTYLLGQHGDMKFLNGREQTKDLNAYRTPDGFHFTAKGYELWGQRIFTGLQTSLAQFSSWKTWISLLSLAGLVVAGVLFWRGR